MVLELFLSFNLALVDVLEVECCLPVNAQLCDSPALPCTTVPLSPAQSLDLARLCRACQRQRRPTTTSRTATSAAAVTKMVMDEASRAILWETPVVSGGVSPWPGPWRWKERTSGRMGERAALGPSELLLILNFTWSWKFPVSSNCEKISINDYCLKILVRGRESVCV